MFDKVCSHLIGGSFFMINRYINPYIPGNKYGVPDEENPELTAEDFKNFRPLSEILPDPYRAMQLPYCYMNGKIRFKGRAFASKKIVKPHGRKPGNFLYAAN